MRSVRMPLAGAGDFGTLLEGKEVRQGGWNQKPICACDSVIAQASLCCQHVALGLSYSEFTTPGGAHAGCARPCLPWIVAVRVENVFCFVTHTTPHTRYRHGYDKPSSFTSQENHPPVERRASQRSVCPPSSSSSSSYLS